MKHAIFRTAVCALALLLLMGASSCKDKQNESSLPAPPSYTDEQLASSVRLDAYTELTVALESENEAKGEAVWRLILSQAEISEYPEEALTYYIAQEREACRYYAEQNGLSEKDAMQALGVSDESIKEKAKQLVKEDLVYEYIRKDANITLTEKEKTELFDRYAQQFAKQYGYRLSYVKESMKEQVFDSMLYDKTMEYLILHNEFTVTE